MTALPKHRELAKTWQLAAKLILNRVSVDAVTRQLRPGRVDLAQTPQIGYCHFFETN
jgi:hypothetical protein